MEDIDEDNNMNKYEDIERLKKIYKDSLKYFCYS